MHRLLAVLAVCAASATAADLKGTWVLKRQSQGFGPPDITVSLDPKGSELQGLLVMPMDDLPLANGIIDGDSFSFEVTPIFAGGPPAGMAPGGGPRPGGGPPAGGPGFGPPRGPMKYTGKITGDLMELTAPSRREGMPPTVFSGKRVSSELRTARPPIQKIPVGEWSPIESNGLAKTPPMGWNSWNHFQTRFDDKTVREIADAIVSSGMKAAGYVYINIDDGWQGTRDDKGVLRPNEKFPNMKALADYVHSKGLKLGIYSSPGPRTCAQYEGSYGHEEQDAKTWAEWGIDYLKYDWCSASRIYQDSEMPAVYARMGAALRKTGRPIVYALCQYGRFNVGEWGPKVGGNLWRTTFDIRDTWESMANIGFSQSDFAKYAGPGHWNDPDMLEVGNGGMNDTESRTHMSLWAMLASPLLAGNDVRNMSKQTAEILLHPEVIAINQDKLGNQATRVRQDGETEIWQRDLADGAKAVALFNRSTSPAKITVRWSELRLPGQVKVRDVWARTERGPTNEQFTAEVPAHGTILLKLTR